MSISAIKSARTYLFASLFCMVFGAIYETFSHGVYSYFMIYAFAVPLVLGTLPALLSGLRGGQAASPACAQLWGAGVAALTVGAVFRGVLDIYGASSPLTRVYWIVGGLSLAASAVLRIRGRGRGDVEIRTPDSWGRTQSTT